MAALKESDIFINRELSWLEFNRRVLDLSKEKNVPLGEQLRFAAIYSNNLDEFFMVRVGSLYDQTLLKSELKENKTGMTAKQQIAAILPRVDELQKHCDKNVAKLFERLQSVGMSKVNFSSLDKEKEKFWEKYFIQELFPVLSPQIVDQRHPFPFLRDREIYVAVSIKEGKRDKTLFGLVPISSHFDRIITIAGEDGTIFFALVEELILHFAHLAFGGSNVLAKCLFRVTRNADINVEEGMFDHDIDYRVVMSDLLKRRRKLAAVRLQFFEEAPPAIASLLQEKLFIPATQCLVQQSSLELSFLHGIAKRLQNYDDPSLFYAPAKPIIPPAEYDLYKAVQKQDVLLCYPYQSFRPFIQMLNKAAEDPDVVSIKMTLYRVADESKIIEALIAAAENGKEVVTIVELRARFDEQNNIDWSRELEQAGCTVIYGFTDFKVHSKLLLITKKHSAKFEYISQIGTGNYNEKTSELYTDLTYITSKPAICEEVGVVFNNLALERLTDKVEHLIVAPLRFKSVLLGEIEDEIAYHKTTGDGRVVIKSNSISDKKIIETLSKASVAGVPIDMIVRGICCLQAGLPGLTENIHVRSIVGRYLEHSRIYAFGKGERFRVYIASGDFLTRNTERRVEVGVKIEDPEIQEKLLDILNMQLADNVNAREMQLNNTYSKIEREKGTPKLDSQMEMYPYLERVLPKQEYKAMAAVIQAGAAEARVQEGMQKADAVKEAECSQKNKAENLPEIVLTRAGKFAGWVRGLFRKGES